LLNSESANEVPFTIKYYDSQNKGLSYRFWDEPNDDYEVKGPLGKGLELSESSTGTHVIFTAGTGVLCFIDLIARLALQNMGIIDKIDGAEKLSDDFKLVLYVSFRNANEAVCLELCEALQNMNKALGKNNFELNVRLSTDSNRRWDEHFIRSKIGEHHQGLKKIWVCGPPVMNETFDKTLEGLANENF